MEMRLRRVGRWLGMLAIGAAMQGGLCGFAHAQAPSSGLT